MEKRHAIVTATGSYFPPKVVPNSFFESYLDTSDEWIKSRTGITERHYVEKGVASSDLALEACKSVLKKRGIGPEEIDAIVFGTVTPDMMYPASACLLQDKLGAKNAYGFDLSAGCCGFVFSYTTGVMMVESGRYDKVLVVGADVCTSFLDMNDRNTCVLFGDGAGAVLLEPGGPDEGMLDTIQHVDGNGGQYLYMAGGGSLNPSTAETVAKNMHTVYQEGREVFKHAVTKMADVAVEVVEKNGFSLEDVDLFVPHQANIRIIESVAKRMKLPREKVMINIHDFGNTTAATVPSCLDQAVENGRLKKGDLLVIASFGAGFTWGSALIRW